MKILDFPILRQTYEYDCGAKAMQSILVYYGIKLSEEKIIRIAKTKKKIGTLIQGMEEVLDRFNLNYDSKQMTIEDVIIYIDKNIPVILLLQAWNGAKIDYGKHFDDSHWVIAVGYDNDRIIFEDPYAFERTYLKRNEIKERWHAKEDNQKIYNYGIAVCGRKANYDSSKIIHMD